MPRAPRPARPRASPWAATGTWAPARRRPSARALERTPWCAPRRPVRDHAERHRRIASGTLGQVRRGGAERAQPGHREEHPRVHLECRLEGAGMVLRRAVRRLHPAREHAPGRPVQRQQPLRAARLVVGRQRRARERGQQQHAQQRAGAPPASPTPWDSLAIQGPELHQTQPQAPEDYRGVACAAGLALPLFLRPGHPNVNPMSLAASPSSQLAVTCALVTGEASVVPFTTISTSPARARLRPA